MLRGEAKRLALPLLGRSKARTLAYIAPNLCEKNNDDLFHPQTADLTPKRSMLTLSALVKPLSTNVCRNPFDLLEDLLVGRGDAFRAEQFKSLSRGCRLLRRQDHYPSKIATGNLWPSR
jgi:hypothetical protein